MHTMFIIGYILITFTIFCIFRYNDTLGQFDKELSKASCKDPEEKLLLDVLILYVISTALILVPLYFLSCVVLKIYKDS